MDKYKRIRFFLIKPVSVGLILVSTLIALVFGELIARQIVNPGDFLLATLTNDPILGTRIQPYTSGHDALGFRNPEVPEQANIVAIGDSLTYGVSAPRDGSWPHQVGTLLHQPVYNMALGGYGPLEYLYLAEHDAIKLRPHVLLVGFYFGNDLMDAYYAAHGRPYWYAWRVTNSDSVGKTEFDRAGEAIPKKHFAAIRDWLSRHSVLYSMMRVTVLRRLAIWEKDRKASQVTSDVQMIWFDPYNPSVRTIFTPQLRLSAEDPKLSSVQEGMRITKQAFASLKNGAEAQGAKLLVVLIPTKERAFCRYLEESGEHIPNAFFRLCDAEQQDKEDLEHFFSTRGIAYVDVTGALEEKIYEHVKIYPADSDAHPQAIGYAAIARRVYETLRDQQFKE